MWSDLFASGGKRLRALGCLVVADALEVQNAAALQLAEAVELTHAATLMHDDVIDEADERRGRTAARRRWSNSISILGGDYLLLRALQLVSLTQCDELVQAHFQSLDALLDSEVVQQMAKRSGDLSVEGYLQVAAGKTGSLFGFSLAAPAWLKVSGRSPRC